MLELSLTNIIVVLTAIVTIGTVLRWIYLGFQRIRDRRQKRKNTDRATRKLTLIYDYFHANTMLRKERQYLPYSQISEARTILPPFAEGDLLLEYQGNQIRHPVVFDLLLFNGGPNPILQTEFESSPRIIFPMDCEIKSVKKYDCFPKELELTRINGNTIGLIFDKLTVNDGIKLRVICEMASSLAMPKPSILCESKPGIKFKSNELSLDQARTHYTFIADGGSGCLIVLGISGFLLWSGVALLWNWIVDSLQNRAQLFQSQAEFLASTLLVGATLFIIVSFLFIRISMKSKENRKKKHRSPPFDPLNPWEGKKQPEAKVSSAS